MPAVKSFIDIFTLIPHVDNKSRILVSYAGRADIVMDHTHDNFLISLTPNPVYGLHDDDPEVLIVTCILSVRANFPARDFFLACGKHYLYTERDGALGNKILVQRDPASHDRENIRFVIGLITTDPQITMGEVIDRMHAYFGHKYGRQTSRSGSQPTAAPPANPGSPMCPQP